ncbi:hypothetical protein BCR44DRAFT_1452885, partial [Catenaria anguillulae PL171]
MIYFVVRFVYLSIPVLAVCIVSLIPRSDSVPPVTFCPDSLARFIPIPVFIVPTFLNGLSVYLIFSGVSFFRLVPTSLHVFSSFVTFQPCYLWTSSVASRSFIVGSV